MVAYNEWLHQVIRTQKPDGPLAPLLPLLQERVLGQLTRWEVGQYSPRYDCSNTLRAIGDSSGVNFIPFTPDLLKKYIAFWNRKGFYQI